METNPAELRRGRIMAIILAASLVVVLIMFVYSLIQTTEAKCQQQIAVMQVERVDTLFRQVKHLQSRMDSLHSLWDTCTGKKV
jgi:hypothetical protein